MGNLLKNRRRGRIIVFESMSPVQKRLLNKAEGYFCQREQKNGNDQRAYPRFKDDGLLFEEREYNQAEWFVKQVDAIRTQAQPSQQFIAKEETRLFR